MNGLIFHYDYIDQYYNCSNRTYEEWKALGNPSMFLGSVYAILGLIYLVIYLPFMAVFWKTDLMKYSCYKIMFFLGIIDCIALPVSGFACGYSAAVGMIYCMAPTFNYLIGNLGLACWCAGSSCCMLLGINRCLDLIDPKLGYKIFGGKKTYLWFLIPVAYFVYFFFFHRSILFNSNLYALFFDPFVGTPERNGKVDTIHYPHVGQSVHNVIVVIVLSIAYLSLCIFLTITTKGSPNNVNMSKLQKQAFLQSTLICTASFVTGIVYVYMQFFPTPLWVAVTAQIAWITNHGAPGLSYALLNPTMKKEVNKVFCHQKHNMTISSKTAISSFLKVSSTTDVESYRPDY